MVRHSKVSRDDRKATATFLYKSRKRRAPGNNPKEIKDTASASAKKIKISTGSGVATDLEMHCRIIDFLLVFSTFSALVKCKKCDGDVTFQSAREEGIGFEIKMKCTKCKNHRYIPSSTKVGN